MNGVGVYVEVGFFFFYDGTRVDQDIKRPSDILILASTEPEACNSDLYHHKLLNTPLIFPIFVLKCVEFVGFVFDDELAAGEFCVEGHEFTCRYRLL